MQFSQSGSSDNLFGFEDRMTQLRLPDADVSYTSHFALPEKPNLLLDHLRKSVPWRQEEVVVWGKRHQQPRLVAWYGDPEKSYTYSGVHLDPLPWSDVLVAIRKAVESRSGHKFNSVLLNLYRDEKDSMGFHSDDEKELGPTPTIASVSLGQKRTLIFKHKSRAELKPTRLDLESGSLLIMKGNTQKHWKHGIEKETRPCGPRVNLTFREIFS